MSRLWRSIGCSLIASFFAAHAQAAELNEDALDAISRAANDICGELLQSGSSNQIEGSVEANVRLKGLMRELLDLGVGGAAGVDTEEFVNVAQSDLAQELASMRDCRLRIWNDLKQAVVASPVAGPEGEQVPVVGETHCDSRANFCAVSENAFYAGELLIVQARLEDFKSNSFLGIMKDTFRAVSTSGTVYKLSDSGGLADCKGAPNRNNCGMRATPGDVVPVVLTFERILGNAPKSGGTIQVRVTGNVLYAGRERAINLPSITLTTIN